jgi:hypothetical protein
LLAVIWGTFLSPKAALSLGAEPKLLAKFLVFGVAALGFWATERPLIAMIFAVLALLNTHYLYGTQRTSGG